MSPTPAEWEKIRQEKQDRIDKAIGNRDKSIAYFNSLNAAIQITQKKDEIVEWRNWFYQQWKVWHLKSVLNLKFEQEEKRKKTQAQEETGDEARFKASKQFEEERLPTINEDE